MGSTVTSQQEGPGFNWQDACSSFFVCGIHMLLLCLDSFPPGTRVSSHSPASMSFTQSCLFFLSRVLLLGKPQATLVKDRGSDNGWMFCNVADVNSIQHSAKNFLN